MDGSHSWELGNLPVLMEQVRRLGVLLDPSLSLETQMTGDQECPLPAIPGQE